MGGSGGFLFCFVLFCLLIDFVWGFFVIFLGVVGDDRPPPCCFPLPFITQQRSCLLLVDILTSFFLLSFSFQFNDLLEAYSRLITQVHCETKNIITFLAGLYFLSPFFLQKMCVVYPFPHPQHKSQKIFKHLSLDSLSNGPVVWLESLKKWSILLVRLMRS